jgi:hypothetical protein
MSKKWLLAILLAATPAAAHDWYPLECCHEQDCAPVDKVELVPTPAASGADGARSEVPALMVTTKHGTVRVPASFPRRESKDHRMHACMMPGGEGGTMRLICIFMPPSI